MLILDRKIGEEIYINKGKIKITVLYEKNGL
ncbi:TPA: carbon storage regulator, partial [Legionella pneumophila]|nr:carbon storage regulator [Legionella pneumophila]